MGASVVGALIVWALLGVGAPAAAHADESATPATPATMNDEARAHYDRGLALYAEKDYAGAVRELEAGYALDPRREFLFAEAQALRLSGDCKSAVPLYQKFLASDPDEVKINATHIALGRCAEQMASARPPEPVGTGAGPHPTTDAPANTPLPGPARPPTPTPIWSAPWYQDVAGALLVGAGVVGIATGTAFTVAAMAARDDANHSAQSYPDYARLWDTARTRSQVAEAGFAAGAALVGVGVFRYWRVRGLRPAPPANAAAAAIDAFFIAPGPAAGGAASGTAGIGGRF